MHADYDIFDYMLNLISKLTFWLILQPSKKQQSSRHEPLTHQDTETGSNESFKSFDTPTSPAPMYIKSLPYNVFRDVYENLQINVSGDWKCLAGKMSS